ncbi:MAG: hypothetical protein CL849_03040 [Crocinitomicaceae bacterium]|nr:hypothetical protein [Crocinitomicaceae bacterium]
MNDAPESERIFNEHITVLSSPWMEGRLPGTPGMEQARRYVEYWFDRAGLEPAIAGEDEPSWRQPFQLGSSREFDGQTLRVRANDAVEDFELGTDFELTGLGGDGSIEGEMVFVGYSIDGGPDEYESYPDDIDLSGKIAVMLRFEPMDDEGNSLWNDRRWSRNSTFSRKFDAVSKRNPAGVILINTPGANDSRVDMLMRDASSVIEDVPVFMMSSEAGSRLVAKHDPEGRSMAELRRLADQGTTIVDLDGVLEGSGDIVETPMFAENVLGVLPGRGDLADEWVVIGGHLDHLGYGEFGSRRGSGRLHPGADDNASGAAALMMLGESLRSAYDELPEDAQARSIMFAAFDAEESGLNGSRHYVRNPPHELEDISLMINFDMIGRVVNDRLSITGADSAEGMSEWLDPLFESSGLEIVKQEGMRGGGSDHASFYQQGIPVLFAICADFHDDYHTPDDTPDQIYRAAGVKTIELFHKIALEAATREEKLKFASPSSSSGRAGPTRSRALRVRLGIRSRQLPDGQGLEVVNVTDGSTAAEGGLQEGDIIKKWDKNPLETRSDLVSKLAELKPGDEVQVLIERDGEESVKFLKMKAPS